VPNFVDSAQFVPEFEPGTAFVYFGRLAPEKGLATLVSAAAAAGSKLHIVGTGPALQSLQALAARQRADVSFFGHLSGEALHQVVRSARAIVLPSEWYENAPMSILEAYALGKPVLGARIGGIPELIREGETGACFESGNVESLASVLREITMQPAAALRQMGREGRLWVEAEFTAERYRDRLLSVYRELGVSGLRA
jgi:glycosyltransferase involved in cell wall biosynthesis